jgi:pyruvate dehydrogenase E2 component (dihydrolipoyllysine-residue acetyltransferase)
MATEVKLPLLGENIPGGDIVEVLVAPGDTVAAEQPLFDVEAEKSTVSVPTPVGGKIAKLLVKKGDHVKTDQVVAVIEEGDGKAPPPRGEKKEEKKPLAEPAKEAPRPVQPPPGAKRQAASASAPEPPPAPQTDGGIVHAGPATRRLAREWGVDLHRVGGSGPKGRITQDDVKSFIRNLAVGGEAAAGGGRTAQASALPDFSKWGPVEAKPLDTIRKRTAEHVSLAWSVIPHVTHHDLADVTDLEAFRKQQEGQGPKLTVTAFVLKALAILLKQMPQFNASLDDAGGKLIAKYYYHLGVAVDTDKGLVVPVLHDVDKKSVHEIAKEMAEAADRARQGKMKPDEMQGGTFTVSNLGGIGGTAFSPIVNWPQVAILGLSRARQQPVWRDGAWNPRLQLPLSLSYDHRVIDGAAAARFCRALAEMLENPMKMLLHA